MFFEIVLCEYFVGYMASRRAQDVVSSSGKEEVKGEEEGPKGQGESPPTLTKTLTSMISSQMSQLKNGQINISKTQSKFVVGRKEEFAVDLGRVWRDTTTTSLLWWFIGFLYMSCRNFQNIILGSGCSVREAEVSGDGVFTIIEGSEPWLEFCHSYIGELEG
ncbi:hypothetical protein TrLO_g11541 [Triparma laevis f. longispina]|uniref:Uncharacterized protein n=1 Tax=Triparma laevis f. longispina TaxID=1714387 RepID=A0A9W7CJR1_9STRA|nr:hypothetical protein TrLO_g11541 [Triparma laevis f. longispina]